MSLFLGNYSYIGRGYENNFNVEVNVGNFTSIGDGFRIVGGDHNGVNDGCVSTFPFHRGLGISGAKPQPKDKPVIIGNDAWICQYVTILDGVMIGDGAVIGAGAVVAKNIPPYAVAVGNPARIKRFRFNERQIEALLQIEWWNWPMEKIMENLKLMEDIDRFIEARVNDGRRMVLS